jgi:hypothetical protein
MLSDGFSHYKIWGILRERYNFYCAKATIADFAKNFYPKRLQELETNVETFKNHQFAPIKSFIDEAIAQAQDIKTAISELTRHIESVSEEIQFVRKFEKLFCNAFDKYVDKYDDKNPKKFLDSQNSEEEKVLRSLVDNMGVQGSDAITTFIQTHNTTSLLRLLAILQTKLLSHRDALVRIHKELFKSYRNCSILQELTVIFERYNSIIIEEFFPDKSQMDQVKFESVRKKILSLYEEFQIRYQGVDAPREVQGIVVESDDISEATKKRIKEKTEEMNAPKNPEIEDRLKAVFGSTFPSP